MDVVKLKATDVLTKIEAFLSANWDIETFEKNRPEDKLVSQAIRLCRSTDSKLSVDQLLVTLNKLIAYYSKTVPVDELDLKVGLRYLIACAAVRLALCIEREIIGTAPHSPYQLGWSLFPPHPFSSKL